MKIKSLIISGIITFLSILLGVWLNNYYFQPLIEYSNILQHSELNDINIENIFIENIGRKFETNISILIKENVPLDDIELYNFSGDYILKNTDTENTIIEVEKLRPKEKINIKLQINGFVDFSIISDSGRIKEASVFSFRNFVGIEVVIAFIAALLSLANYYFTKKEAEKEMEYLRFRKHIDDVYAEAQESKNKE